jgi:hypothetical protein
MASNAVIPDGFVLDQAPAPGAFDVSGAADGADASGNSGHTLFDLGLARAARSLGIQDGTAARLARTRYHDGRHRVRAALAARAPLPMAHSRDVREAARTGSAVAQGPTRARETEKSGTASEPRQVRTDGQHADDIHFILGAEGDAPLRLERARQVAGDPEVYSVFGARDAVDAGEKFASTQSGLDIGAARKAIAKMNLAERRAFRTAYASTLIKQLMQVSNRDDVLTQVFVDAPRAKKNIAFVLGREGAKRLEARMRLADMCRQSKGRSAGAQDDASAFRKSIVDALLSASRDAIDIKTAHGLADSLASADLAKLHAASATVASSANLLHAVRRAHARLSA